MINKHRRKSQGGGGIYPPLGFTWGVMPYVIIPPPNFGQAAVRKLRKEKREEGRREKKRIRGEKKEEISMKGEMMRKGSEKLNIF